MTNRRRITGGAFNFGAFGLLPRVCGVGLAAIALRFNIVLRQTNGRVGSEIHFQTTANLRLLTKLGAFIAVKLELRTPED
jgi:hypothetical protein